MSMSTYVMGIWPPDDRFKEMLNVYRACEETGVTIPTEVETFFNDDVPNESGVVTQLKLEDDVGDGQRVDVPQWTPAQLAVFREFERAMGEDVIPEVVRVLRMREDRWRRIVNPWQGDDASGLEVDLRKLPADVKTIRFVNSW